MQSNMALKLADRTLTCTNCHRQFDSRALVSSSFVLLKQSDFHDRYREGESVLPYLIHFCEACGFCAEERFFTPEFVPEAEDPSFQYAFRDFVAEILTPNVKWAREYLADRYHNALRVAEFTDQNSLYLGDLALRGSWAAVEERDYESERYFRRLAAHHYTDALRHYDMIDRDKRANVTYLIGELWRRVGDTKLAHEWFDAVADAVVDDSQQWLMALAERQRVSPQDSL